MELVLPNNYVVILDMVLLIEVVILAGTLILGMDSYL
ncbi:Uncharacterised protein [Streptococcus pneumoniae]|nr:Uncharacterised protein [Streptococcus pneumoniae]